MICLTGDVHHDSLRINDHNFFPAGTTEMDVCLEYLAILEMHNIKSTLYKTSPVKCLRRLTPRKHPVLPFSQEKWQSDHEN